MTYYTNTITTTPVCYGGGKKGKVIVRVYTRVIVSFTLSALKQ